MALLSDYTAGTVSIAAGGVAVTGNGTGWLAAGFKEGDLFFANGFVGVVQSVASNTALTLAQPWQGGALNSAPYRLRFQGDGSRVSAQARQLIDLLGGTGSVQALAALLGSPDTLAYFTGAGAMALADFKAFGKALAGLSSGSAGQFLRTAAGPPYGPALQPILGGVSQSGGVPTGSLIEQGSNAGGKYIRFADGTQICTRYIGAQVNINSQLGSLFYGSIGWVFPASFPVADFAAAGSCRVGGQIVELTGGDSSPTGWDSFLVSPVSITNAAAVIRQVVIGRWF